MRENSITVLILSPPPPPTMIPIIPQPILVKMGPKSLHTPYFPQVASWRSKNNNHGQTIVNEIPTFDIIFC